jgi:DNA-binding GntR family transcriptional regulator
MEKKTRKPNVLLSDFAYQSVRDAISSKKFKPGDRVSEYMVADWLKISRTPAREALRRLENEGLLAADAHRGLVVATLDDSEMHELYAAREILESASAALAARFATDAQIAALQHLVEREPEIAGDPDKMYRNNQEFHRLVYDAARNRYLFKFFQSITDTLTMHRTVSTMMSAPRREEVLREHRELVEAIARRDEEGAREAALRHIRNALRARIQLQREPAART